MADELADLEALMITDGERPVSWGVRRARPEGEFEDGSGCLAGGVAATREGAEDAIRRAIRSIRGGDGPRVDDGLATDIYGGDTDGV